MAQSAGQEAAEADGLARVRFDSVQDPDSSPPTVDGFECAVCTELMEDPVVTADGHSYCRVCILDWFRTCDEKVEAGRKKDARLLSPATSLPLLSRPKFVLTPRKDGIFTTSNFLLHVTFFFLIFRKIIF